MNRRAKRVMRTYRKMSYIHRLENGETLQDIGDSEGKSKQAIYETVGKRVGTRGQRILLQKKDEIFDRLLKGEKTTPLAKEYGVSDWLFRKYILNDFKTYIEDNGLRRCSSHSGIKYLPKNLFSQGSTSRCRECNNKYQKKLREKNK